MHRTLNTPSVQLTVFTDNYCTLNAKFDGSFSTYIIIDGYSCECNCEGCCLWMENICQYQVYRGNSPGHCWNHHSTQISQVGPCISKGARGVQVWGRGLGLGVQGLWGSEVYKA